jgi:hypothetical protein
VLRPQHERVTQFCKFCHRILQLCNYAFRYFGTDALAYDTGHQFKSVKTRDSQFIFSK